MVEQTRAPYSTRCRVVRVNEQDRYVAGKPIDITDEPFVDDVDTIVDDIKGRGQHDRKIMMETEVTHHTEAFANKKTSQHITTMTALVDTEVSALEDTYTDAPASSDMKVTPLANTEFTALSQMAQYIHIDEELS